MWRGPHLFLQHHFISCCSHSSLPVAHVPTTPLPLHGLCTCCSLCSDHECHPSFTQLTHNHLSYHGSITVTCSEKSFLTLMSTQIPFSVPASMVATAVPARPYPHPHPLSGHPHTPRAPCCKTLWLPAGWLLSVHERPPPHLETGVRGRNRSGRLWGPWYRVQILFLVQWEGIWEF